MAWHKKGLIWRPKKTSWAASGFLQPTPIVMGNVIRLYGGRRDAQGVSRVGYVELDANDPSKVLSVSDKPVLDVGAPGFFDDNGVVPCALVNRGAELYLYYAGYNLGHQVRFTVLAGLAVSRDGGETFERVQTTPILERVPGEELFRVIHSIFQENGVWRVYYGAGNAFIQNGDRTLPLYNIRYMESPDGLSFPQRGSLALDIGGSEYRVGRPFVTRQDNGYAMYFGYSEPDSPYKLGYAHSPDGHKWTRDDAALGLDLSVDGFDSRMMAYPAVVHHKNRSFLFYNGNDYGHEGFGYAEWTP